MTIPSVESVPIAHWARLARWMAEQRWYANKGSLPALEEIGSWELISPEPGVRLRTHLLLDHANQKSALYQVPLSYRDAPLAGTAAFLGRYREHYVYDGPHDAAYASALLEFMMSDRELDGDRMWAGGRRTTAGLASGFLSRVLTGEQSNTSIVFEPPGEGMPVICKVFRALHNGDNPDVELQTALAAAGSTTVPRPVGNVLAQWRDTGEVSGQARGHLVFAQEFLPGAVDGWQIAVAAGRVAADFSVEARALGAATAGMHATLARALPSAATSVDDVRTIIGRMHGRLATALTELPGLASFAPAIGAIFERAATMRWPDQQRIHGDLHLGQVLSVPGRGWTIVDFEGEPLRPMRERCVLDSPLRDVAGMLRSFDYVAGALELEELAVPAEGWASIARVAFAEGYGEASGCDLAANRALVDAFELDKALYECVYEVRNRPQWLRIPVSAIERILGRP